ncbi:MAG: hypothetical protein SGILL_002928 [Bacillariaceae sp.]
MPVTSEIKEKLKLWTKRIGPSASSRKKVVVIGSDYHVGKATVLALTKIHDDAVEAYAGTDDKLVHPVDIDGVQTVKADLADKINLSMALTVYDSAYIVVPLHAGGVQLTINGIEAAKEAGIKFVLLLAVIPRDTDDTTFEKEFAPAKDAIERCGIDFAIVRLPLDDDTPIAVGDAGKESASILAHPSQHVGKTYSLETAR